MSKRFYADLDDTPSVSVKVEKSAKRTKRPWKSDKKAVSAMVKKAVLKLAETKSYQASVNTNLGGYNATSWNTFCLRPITPNSSLINIIGGTGQADRIGNKIRTKKVTLDVALYSKPYDVSTNPNPQPCEVIMWFFGIKEQTTTPTDLSGFFQNGNTTSDPSGSLVDGIKTINTDKYIVYKKVIKKLGYSSYSGTGVSVASQSYNNNDYKINHNFRVDLTKYCPSTVTWSDSNNPYTKAVFWAVDCVPVNGATFGVTTLPAQAYFNLNYEFTDV